MQYITEVSRMGILDNLTKNIYMMDFLFTIVLVISAYASYKRHTFYNRDPKMEKHNLNILYHLNEKKKLDLDWINFTFFKTNTLAALVAGAVIALCAVLKLNDNICIAIGLVALFVASYFTQQLAYKTIAKKYEHSK